VSLASLTVIYPRAGSIPTNSAAPSSHPDARQPRPKQHHPPTTPQLETAISHSANMADDNLAQREAPPENDFFSVEVRRKLKLEAHVSAVLSCLWLNWLM
jgi:hypothetical protein